MKFNFEKIEMFKKPYVIAEIGSNHNGDMKLAKNMILAAKEAGADCVKFQSWTKDSIFSKKTYEDNFFLADDYRQRTDTDLETIVDKYHISQDDHRLLKKYCDEIEIEFNSTPFSFEEVDFLVEEFDVPFIKIASMDLNNIPFLRYVAKKNKPIVISTGLCPLSDVSLAVETLRAGGCSKIILLHCVSIYPTPPEDANLNNIDMLKRTFELKVGYSDHTWGSTAPVIAMAKGACIIEKHFTTDNDMVGWDHKMSANPEILKEICDAAKVVPIMLGNYQKTVPESAERKNAFQRSIVAARDIKAGETFTREDLEFKRPGTGISPKYIDFIVGKTAKRDLDYDEIIKMSDF